MAKGNMLLGHARGKVGDLVFSRSNGQQVTRARAAVVKNPQTTAQMLQRVVMNTVSQAYSKMSGIVDHSFEGVEKGQKSMSFFVKSNINALRSYIAAQQMQGKTYADCFSFTPLGSNRFMPNAYIVSKGQLPEIKVAAINDSVMATSIVLAANSTYADVISQAGLQRGDQLTFICVSGTEAAATFHVARVILDPHNADGTSADLSVAFIADGAVNLPSPKNEGEITISVVDGKLGAALSTEDVMCAAVIVSRKRNDGSFLRSNATMFVAADAATLYGVSLQDCIDAVYGNSIVTDNPMYLNNAGTQGTASASTSGDGDGNGGNTGGNTGGDDNTGDQLP